MSTSNDFVRVAQLTDLDATGMLTVQVSGRTLLIVEDDGNIYALDNRCPHMGFPLSRGSVQDGLIICHWHHARFDLCSGGTFDLWADDVVAYPAEVRDGEIWLDPKPYRDEVAYQKGRLRDGLEQDLRLLSAKAILSLLDSGVAPSELLRIGGRFGALQRNAGWRDGLTIMTALGNLLSKLETSDRPLALYHGMLHVAANVVGQRPHFEIDPLPTTDLPVSTLKSWLRQFAEVRDREGVERVVLTAIAGGAGDKELADMLVAAVTDHYFMDGGHAIDFINKAFELLDEVGWQEADVLLPSVIPGIVWGQRMEESSNWRQPIDLEAILEPVFTRLLAGELIDDVHREGSIDAIAFDHLVETLLGDDPRAIALALAHVLEQGAGLTQVSLSVFYAAALRVARFHTSNEFNDWIAVLHTFTSANATHQLLRRAPSLEGARSIWHVAMHLYLNRFLNLPAARFPSEHAVAQLPSEASELQQLLLECTDRRGQVERAAAITYRYLSLGLPPERLNQTLAHILLREDGEFHSYQMLESAVQLFTELGNIRPDLAPTVLIALARYLAGHAPTDRATTQTYRIALRLHAGEALATD